MMRRKTLYVTAPRSVRVKTEDVAPLEANQVRVRTACTAVSPGTELLQYRGEQSAADGDQALDAVGVAHGYPFAPGYSAVGTVEAVGAAVDADVWMNRRVFAFQPHTSRFVAAPADLTPLPDAVSFEEAAFLPNIETAVNVVLDANPRIGERVVVLGQGVVGLFVTALLSRHPLDSLVTLDPIARRRAWSVQFGAQASFDPTDEATSAEMQRRMPPIAPDAPDGGAGADLIVEATGQPKALDDALCYAGYDSDIVVASWYGTKRYPVDLGGAFHRRRITIRSSQVSTLSPSLRGRWDRARRMQAALENIDAIKPSRIITHKYNINEAEGMYDELTANRLSMLGILVTYEEK